jgi:hypothetical protein
MEISMADSSEEIVQQYNKAYEHAYTAFQSYFPLADRDLRFYLGDQWEDWERRELESQGRSALVINKIRPNINMVSGYNRKHAHSCIVVPVEGSDQKTSDQLTKILLYVMQYGDGYEMLADCVSGSYKTGWNLASVWVDYRNDPIDGDIMFQREPYSAFLCDPDFSKKDFSDCGFICRRKYLSLDKVISILPKKKKQLEELQAIEWNRDEKFTWLPYQRLPTGQVLMACDEYWVQGWEDVKVIIDRTTGEIKPYEADEEFLMMHPEFEIIKKQQQFVKQHIIVNGVHMDTVKNPNDLNEYPFVPVFAIFESECADFSLKIQSLCRAMIDPQIERNKRRSQMSDIIESQINSGWIATENSVVNPRSLYQTGQGKVVWRKQDAQQGSLERLQPAQIPPSLFQLTDYDDRDLKEVAGISDELLGQADSEQDSGLKVLLRQSTALVGLQDVLENGRYAQEVLSKKILKLIQNWSAEKLKRILGEEPTEQLKNRESLRYDISIQEGVLTNTQQELFFRQMVTLKQLGEPIPPGFLTKIAPLQGKSEYNQAMQEFSQQQAQQAQQAAKVEEETRKNQGQLFQSQSILNLSSAKEKVTNASANLAQEDEREASAVDKRADAVLKRAQAAKQLEGMDQERFLKFVDMFLRLEERNRTREQEEKAENIQQAASVDVSLPQEAPQQEQQQPQQQEMMQQMAQQMQQGAPQ